MDPRDPARSGQLRHGRLHALAPHADPQLRMNSGASPSTSPASSGAPETASVVLAAVCLAVLVGQHVAARATRDALFLSTFDATSLPAAMLVAALVGLATVLGTARAMARF